MAKKNFHKELHKQDPYLLRMLLRSEILRMRLLTLFVMALRKDIKLAYPILMTYLALIPANSLLSLVYLVPVNLTSLTKWLSDIIVTTTGERLLRHQKTRLRIYMLTS